MWTVTPSVEWFQHTLTHPHTDKCFHAHTRAHLRTVRLLQLTCFLSKLFIFIYVLFISLSPSPSLSPLSHISFIVLCYFSFCCFSSSFMPDFVMAVAPFFSAEIIAARPNMLTLWGCPAQRCHMLRTCVYV